MSLQCHWYGIKYRLLLENALGNFSQWTSSNCPGTVLVKRKMISILVRTFIKRTACSASKPIDFWRHCFFTFCLKKIMTFHVPPIARASSLEGYRISIVYSPGKFRKISKIPLLNRKLRFSENHYHWQFAKSRPKLTHFKTFGTDTKILVLFWLCLYSFVFRSLRLK